MNERFLDAVTNTLSYHDVWMRVLDGHHDAHPLVRASYPAEEDGIRPIRNLLLDWADRGAVWDWHGQRFGALGGGVLIDRARRVDGVSYWATETITDAGVDTLIDRASHARVDVLFSHDAPLLRPASANWTIRLFASTAHGRFDKLNALSG